MKDKKQVMEATFIVMVGGFIPHSIQAYEITTSEDFFDFVLGNLLGLDMLYSRASSGTTRRRAHNGKTV